MAGRMTRQQVLEMIAAKRPGGEKLRVVQAMVAGKEIRLAHVIGNPDASGYTNLGLDIGFHAGENQISSGSIGIMNITPKECVLIAADIAVKTGDVEIGFMDRFGGTLIIVGARAEVDAAMNENLRFFRDDMKYRVCPMSYQ